MDTPTPPPEVPSAAEEPRTAPWRRFLRGLDRERAAVWLLVFAGALIRCWYLWDFSGSPLFDLPLGPDVGEYYLRAQGIANGRFFPVSPDIHAPLYSCFLALMMKLGCGVPAIRVVQIVLNFGAWLGFYWLLREKRTPLGIRLAFLGIALLLPVPVFYQAELVSETLLIPLAAVFFWLRHLAGRAGTPGRRTLALFGAGLALGAMNLTHPLTLFFSAAEVGWELFSRSFRRAALLAAALAVTVGGFCLAQSLRYGKSCGIQANAGFNIYLGNNPGASGGCYLRPGKSWRRIHREAEEEAKRRGISADAVFLRRVGDFWLHHPGKALRLWGIKACKVLSPSELVSGSDLPAVLCFTTVVFYGRLLTPALFLLAAFGLWRIFRTRGIRFVHYLLLFFAMYFAQVVTVTSGRYRMLMFVPAALFAAVGMCDFNWRRYWFLPLLAISACAVFTITDYGRRRGETAILYAEAALEKGDWRQAEALAAFAFRSLDDPDPARCCEIRGEAALELHRRALDGGRLDEAQKQLDAAGKYYLQMIEAEPTYYRGWMHLAILAENVGTGQRAAGRHFKATEWFCRAELWYREALRYGAQAPDLRCNYASFRIRTGQPCAAAVDAAIRTAPAWSQPWHLAGIVAMRDGDFARAVECFGRAYELSTDERSREVNLNNLRNAEHQLRRSR